ncbi:sperm-associated antigen 17-like isoform X4 [Biomphalaria glabrata]|uniref:Sperm-associated antigen 17-like isoform X4 n=1 Tax=Biomphalaria glabrata TaxID=6526 RepID=A0A9W3AKT2_BIOGL|nr:sperm-associated antigen 17-like isoform X4 [Biomphalaria glabrata]
MAKAGKRGKSGDVKATASPRGKGENNYASGSFAEETWNPCLAWIVGKQPEDFKHVEALNIITLTGIRRLFSVVTKELLFNELKVLGNPHGQKKEKGKDAAPTSDVYDSIRVYLETNEPIPTDLLAKVIKWKLMMIKANDLKRREADIKAKKVKTGLDKEKRNKSATKSPKRGGKKTPEIQIAKEGSKLKKRGEEDDDAKYIDDEPDDGAQQYILISGFHDPHIFKALEEIGVNVSCILRLSTQDSNSQVKKSDINSEDQHKIEIKIPEKELTKEICLFWRDLLPLLQHLPDSSHCHDIAILDYEVKSFIIPTDPIDAEQKVQYSSTLFEEVAVMLYNLLEAKRLYGTFKENLNLINVPVFGDKESFSSVNVQPVTELENVPSARFIKSEVDMRYYNDLMNCIPQESVSVSLIMSCMLEQVIATEEEKIPPSEEPPPTRSDGIHFYLASYLANTANKLPLSEKEYNSLSEVLDLPQPPPEVPMPPLLINIHDKISMRTRHLKPYYGFDPHATENDLLRFLPFAKLCDLRPPPTPDSKESAVRLQELIHYCASDGLTKPEIDRAFKQFVFESMDLAATDSNGFFLKKEIEGVPPTAIPWDDPYPLFKIMVPDVNKINIENSKENGVAEESSAKLELMVPATLSVKSLSSIRRVTTVGSTKFLTPFGGSGKVSGVIMELKVNLGPGSCSTSKSRHASLDSKKGILLNRDTLSTSSSKKSQAISVHFDIPVGLEENEDDFLEATDKTENTFEEGLLKMIDIQQRNLDQWCFAEHYKPHILQQVLLDASYYLPIQDTYYHKRDNSVLLVLHNPFNREFKNHFDWHKEIHSDMGFRNYLEYTVESISDWLKEKEAEYQGKLLSKEIDTIYKEEEEKAREAEKLEKAKRIKSPNRSASRTKSPGKSPSNEKITVAINPYIRQGSLKAQQAENDKLAKEEEEKERQKLERKSRSSQTKERTKEDKTEKEKSKSPRGSAKSSKTAMNEQEIVPTVEPVKKSKYWPFYGYNTGNQLIHISGLTTTLFPTDGGQIKIDRTEIAQGTTSVKSSLFKDDHIFTVHLLNPVDKIEKQEEEKLQESKKLEEITAQGDQPISNESPVPITVIAEEDKAADSRMSVNNKNEQENQMTEASNESKVDVEEKVVKNKVKQKPVSQFGSVTAVLSDGMVLAFSQFGPSGESKAEILKESCHPTPAKIETPNSLQNPLSPARSKKESKRSQQLLPDSIEKFDEPINEVKVEEHRDVIQQEFQDIFVTCPDGLQVMYFLQSSVGIAPSHTEDFQLAVRQCYPFKTNGFQECESARHQYLMKEISRTITPDGNVIKMMTDGSVEVLSADSTVSIFTGHWSSQPSRPESPVNSTKAVSPDSMGQKTMSHSQTRAKSSIKITESELEEKVNVPSETPYWTITYPNGERLQISPNKEHKELPAVPISIATDPDTQQTMATRDDHVVTVSFPDGTTIVEHADGTRITVYYRETPITVETEDDKSSLELKTFKFIKVECPTYATVEFNGETSENLTVFGNGTSINVFPDGYYILHHCQGGRIEVDTEGTMVYYPRRKLFIEHIMPERPLQYILRHNAEVIVETEDPDGHIFHVKANGDFTISNSHDEDILSDMSDDDLETKAKKIIAYNQHAPRFFIIHADGSGTELLRFQDVAEYLSHAELNPATAVMKEPIQDHPGVTGITILKPYLSSLSEKWFKKYDQESIIPSGIRCRDLLTLPPKEVKKPGPKFGTNVGKGLNIGSLNKGSNRISILKCPNKLELRQLIQYKPMTEQLRNRLKNGVLKYSEAVVARMRADNLMAINDPRSEEEKIMAEELRKLSLKQQECDLEHVKSIYEKAIAPRVPTPPPTPRPKRTQADWQQDKREVEEEKKNKSKLKNKAIEPYFESEVGKAFLLSQANDVEEMMRQLVDDQILQPVDNRDVNSEMSFTPNLYNGQNNSQSQESDHSTVDSSPNGKKYTRETPSAGAASEVVTPLENLRPHNPTPAHATGQISPAIPRPDNPTPAQAGKLLAKKDSVEFTNKDQDSSPLNPLSINLLGQSRTEPIPLPLAIQGGRPGAQINKQFLAVEEPARRKVKTSLITGATPKGQKLLVEMRGLICQPEQVNFGVLKEGSTYAYNIFLRNTGVDTCRFKVTQPPPATGLRVLYQPGPVAAGMCANLTLELYAIANGVEGESGVGKLEHVLEVITETHVLEIPVQATILTADEYESKKSTQVKESYARLVSNKPPALTGIIRPRKDQRISMYTLDK